MNFFKSVIFFVVLIFLSYTGNAHAQNLMTLYRTSVSYFPSIKSFNDKEKSLKSENKGLGWQRIIDMDLSTSYSRLSTENLGNYFDGDISFVNNFDIFNKKGADRKINNLEIRKNKSLSDSEKKNLFTLINEAYFNYIRNTKLLGIHEESLGWIDKNIILVNAAVENGFYPEVEISRWKIERLNCMNLIAKDKLEIAGIEQTLKILTGLDTFRPEETESKNYAEVSEESILKNSPELTVFEMEKKQAETEISKERFSRLPDFQVGNSLVRNNEPQSTGDYYQISANLNFKLFDGGRIYRIKSNMSRINSIENDEKAARAMLTEFYRNKINEMNTRKEIMTNLKEASGMSSENLDKLLIGYKKKFVDFSTIFLAYRDDISLRENLINSEADFNQSYQYLYHLSLGDIYF